MPHKRLVAASKTNFGPLPCRRGVRVAWEQAGPDISRDEVGLRGSPEVSASKAPRVLVGVDARHLDVPISVANESTTGVVRALMGRHTVDADDLVFVVRHKVQHAQRNLAPLLLDQPQRPGVDVLDGRLLPVAQHVDRQQPADHEHAREQHVAIDVSVAYIHQSLPQEVPSSG